MVVVSPAGGFPEGAFFAGVNGVAARGWPVARPGAAATPAAGTAWAERMLAAVLFTDVVGSTEQVVALGDRPWRDVLAAFHALVRRRLERYRGRAVDAAGDGCFAVFDSPGRAIRCAGAIRSAARRLGLEVRAGVHAGECEVAGSAPGGLWVRGIAVHIGARVQAKAGAGEILVSSTAKEAAAGSGLRFRDRGRHALRGLPGRWRLFAADVADGAEGATAA